MPRPSKAWKKYWPPRMVSFTGDKEMLYRANFCLRTALRILKPIKHFTAADADAVYEAVKEIRWEDYLDPAKSFAVDATVFSEEFRHSKFVSYRVKVEAPLNEVLAAGMILLTGWKGECDLIDPMCGSGTIPIEAALIARNIAPGVFRQGYAFENWPDFDADLLERIYNDDSQEREFAHKIYGYDNSIKANAIAQRNVKAAGVGRDIVLKVQPFQQFEQPQEKSLIITNPPYGERISSTDLLGLYQMIGERLKHAFTGNTAWVLSYRDECFDQIGLKPSARIPLQNGGLDCEFRKYEIFDGKYKEFREGGEALDKPRQAEHRERRGEARDSRDRRPSAPRRPFRADEKERRRPERPERPERDRRPRSGESYPERKRREAREDGGKENK